MKKHMIWRGPGRLRYLPGDESGAVAVSFAIAALALFILVAAALDYARALALQQRMQIVLDDAMLSAIKDRTGADKVDLAARYFAMELTGTAATELHFAYDANTRVLQGSAKFDLPLTFGAGWGATMSVGVHGSAGSNSDKIRALDIVMCIQATDDSKVLAPAKAASASFYTSLDAELSRYGVPRFDQTRVRPIFYRNYGGFAMAAAGDFWSVMPVVGAVTSGRAPQDMGADSGDSDALKPYDFFNLTARNADFAAAVSQEAATGGGSGYSRLSSGLECINEAMQSSWAQVGGRTDSGQTIDYVYPLIVQLASEPATPLNFVYSVQNPNYPGTMPRDDASFAAKWNALVANQPNLALKMLGIQAGDPSLTAIVTPPDGFSRRVNNGYNSIVALKGFSQSSIRGVTSSSIIPDIAAAVANSYARTALAQ